MEAVRGGDGDGGGGTGLKTSIMRDEEEVIR